MRFGCAAIALGLGMNVACSDGVATPVQRVAAVSDGDAGSDEGDAGRVEVDCETVDGWPEAAEDAESALISMMNQARDYGFSCGSDDRRLQANALRPAEELRCAARVHTRDMIATQVFMNRGSDGSDPRERMEAAGFDVGDNHGESIIVGTFDPQRVLAQLLRDWDDCLDLGEGDFTAIGVGYEEGVWTIDYAEHDDRR